MKKKFSVDETYKFIINGLFATLVHFLVLLILISFSSLNYGFSNFIGYIFSITSSFLGNKFFVFKDSNNAHAFTQVIKFIFLYLFLAINSGFALYIWTDINKYNFVIGFLGITALNTIISFMVNKFLIYNPTHEK
tara:strand:- start:2053 stop:2457 length:405 start_codon:yes stop_codon:yes gene_type:complete